MIMRSTVLLLLALCMSAYAMDSYAEFRMEVGDDPLPEGAVLDTDEDPPRCHTPELTSKQEEKLLALETEAEKAGTTDEDVDKVVVKATALETAKQTATTRFQGVRGVLAPNDNRFMSVSAVDEAARRTAVRKLAGWRSRGSPDTATKKVKQVPTIEVNVYVHVVTKESDACKKKSAAGEPDSTFKGKANKGYVSPAVWATQLAALNAAYKLGTHEVIKFTTASIDYICNNDWFDAPLDDRWTFTTKTAPPTSVEYTMMTKMVKGTPENGDLNVYLRDAQNARHPTNPPPAKDGAFGYATFPYQPEVLNFPKKRGMVIAYDHVKSHAENAANYNLGFTVIHEAGHIFGLAHTFQPSCNQAHATKNGINPSRDAGVTYYTLDGAKKCRGKKSCGTDDRDSVENPMHYSRDYCYTTFTPEQFMIMHTNIASFLPKLMSSL